MEQNDNYFTDKPFLELTKEDIQRMVRAHKYKKRFTIEEMLTRYQIDIDKYCKRIRELGLKVSRDESNYWRKHKKDDSKPERRDQTFIGITGNELKAMRIMRGKTILQMSQLIGMPVRYLKDEEMERKEVPNVLAEEYIVSLGITKAHMIQLRKILKGELKTFTENRLIPSAIKNRVRKRCGYKCTKCGSKQKLHIHHIEHFAKGGQNDEENLTLLCASCHANEHKDNKAYYLLKKLAEE